MSATFPCPNPVCKYIFQKAILPAAAMVTCPVCRTRFPYKDGQVLNSSGAPAAAAPSAPAVSQEAEDGQTGWMAAVPTAPPARTPAPQVPNTDNDNIITKAETDNSGSLAKTILLLVGTIAFLVVGVLVLYSVVKKNPFDASGGTSAIKDDDTFNFKFAEPGDEWKNDLDTRTKLEVNCMSVKHTEPDAWFCLFAQDFKDRNPRQKEVELLMRERINKYFRSPEIENRTDETKKVGSLPAQYFVFNGEANGQQMTGESHFLIHKGVAYIFFAWAPSKDVQTMTAEFAAMRNRFAISNKRERWVEQKSQQQTFAGTGFSVSDDEDAWRARAAGKDYKATSRKDFINDPKDYDDKCMMALRAKLPVKNPRSRGIDFIPEAQAFIIELPGGSKPQEAVQKYLTDRLAKEEAGQDSKSKLEESKTSPSETNLPEGGTPVLRLVSRDPRSPSSNRFYVISAVSQSGKIIGLIAESSSRDAKYMEPYMLKLAASLSSQ